MWLWQLKRDGWPLDLLPPAGRGDRHAGPLHPGHRRRREHRRSQRRGAAGHRPDHHGHWCLHGTELRLPAQPRQGPGAPAIHRRCRLGNGGVQVSCAAKYWKLFSHSIYYFWLLTWARRFSKINYLSEDIIIDFSFCIHEFQFSKV